MSSGTYDHAAIEPKWRAYWLSNKTFNSEIDLDKPKYYVLDMFPYPSGDGLHVGHPLGYVATDGCENQARIARIGCGLPWMSNLARI